jgi:hypothetical protein
MGYPMVYTFMQNGCPLQTQLTSTRVVCPGIPLGPNRLLLLLLLLLLLDPS